MNPPKKHSKIPEKNEHFVAYVDIKSQEQEGTQWTRRRITNPGDLKLGQDKQTLKNKIFKENQTLKSAGEKNEEEIAVGRKRKDK